MNEFERTLYLKYRNIENMTQLLCFKLYQYITNFEADLNFVAIQFEGNINDFLTTLQLSSL